QAEKVGWGKSQWGNSENPKISALAFASFVMMVDKEKGTKLMNKIKAIADDTSIVVKKKHFSEEQKASHTQENTSTTAPSTQDWWDIF
ncbi:MAG: hypothetical protein SFU27_10135, partial [Thermonemataceae bacterium]|nr:hypothetical protein [Thermonemataceae bacterium]